MTPGAQIQRCALKLTKLLSSFNSQTPVMLIHIVYVSKSLQPFGADQWMDLLSHARQKNAQLNVTGLLLKKGSDFFQVIEGQEDVLARLYATIAADPRHTQVVKIMEEPIAKRAFADWSMASAELTQDEFRHADGFSDFFVGGTAFADLSHGRARKLIAAFDGGRWRNRIDAPAPLVSSHEPQY